MTMNFAETGFLAKIAPGAEITRYQVLGERSSGTNFATRLIGRNTALEPSDAMGWKHGFPHALAVPRDLLVVGIVRRADDWARSMHAKPWHATAALQSLPFSDFLKAEWDTSVDRGRFFANARRNGQVGQPLQLDRHPLTGRRFANIFAMRQAKLAGLLSYMDRDCAFLLIRLETLQNDPEAMVGRMLDALGQNGTGAAFRPVSRRLGSKFKAAIPDRPPTPKALSASDLTFMRGALNTAQEHALGYSYV